MSMINTLCQPRYASVMLNIIKSVITSYEVEAQYLEYDYSNTNVHHGHRAGAKPVRHHTARDMGHIWSSSNGLLPVAPRQAVLLRQG